MTNSTKPASGKLSRKYGRPRYDGNRDRFEIDMLYEDSEGRLAGKPETYTARNP